MALKDRVQLLRTPDEVDQFLAKNRNWDITSQAIAEPIEGHFTRV